MINEKGDTKWLRWFKAVETWNIEIIFLNWTHISGKNTDVMNFPN